MPRTIADETRKIQLFEKLQHSVLVSLNKDELERLSASSKIVVYAKGDFIIQEGSYDDRIFCLISGEVDVRKSRDVSIAILRHAGDIFGEMGVIDGGARSASVRALKDNTICLSIDAGMLDSPREKAGKGRFLDKIFTHLLAQRLRVTTEELSALKEELAIHRRALDAMEKQIAGTREELIRAAG